MSKFVDPSQHRNPGDAQAQAPCPEGQDRVGNKPWRPNVTDGNHLLGRILNTPGLEKVVPRLQPNLLHRIIQTCGLEDCSEIVALATSRQLEGIFDLDLWRASQPGTDEQFDPDRFGLWIEVLAEAGAKVAAEKVAGISVELVVTGLVQHARVYDRAAVMPYQTLEGEWIEAYCVEGDGLTCDMGGYLLVAKRAQSWDSIIEVLLALREGHSDYFHQLMDGCRTLSNSGRELDGLDELLAFQEQAMFDVGGDREGRREKQGYVTPAQARAFLQLAREINRESQAAPPANPLARAYFEALRDCAGEAPQETVEEKPGTSVDSESRSPDLGSEGLPAPENDACSVSGIDANQEAAVGSPSTASTPSAAEDTQMTQDRSSIVSSEEIAEAEAYILDVLSDAGILERAPRALLGSAEDKTARLCLIQTFMQCVADNDQTAYSARNEELAYLANTLIAGCSMQGRPFTAQEASDAVVAVCNLGLENWPHHWLPANAASLPLSFLIDHDVISVFQVGWVILHRDVCMHAAERLISELTRTRCIDPETQVWLDRLRIRMAKQWRAGTPWRAREELEVLAILDMPTWAVLLGLIDECPALHPFANTSKSSGMRSVTTFDFEFISENSQIASIHEFMQSLAERLSS